MSSNIRINKNCQQCGNEFVAKTTTTKYCSHACANRAYKARKKAEKIEVVQKATEREKIEPLLAIQAKDFLSMQEVCQLFNVSRTTVWRLAKEGKVKSARIGRKKFITRASIDALFEPDVHASQPPEPDKLKIEDCWHIGEIEKLFDLHSKTLYDIIRRFEIPTIKEGKYVYAPKQNIMDIFGDPKKLK